MLQRIAKIQPELPIKAALTALTAGFVGLVMLAQSAVSAEFPPTEGDMGAFVLVKNRPAAPEVAFLDEDEEAVAVPDFAGKVLLINFWATWCPPCVREMPALDRLQADMGSDDFKVIAISADAGGKAEVQVSESELNQAIMSQAMQFRGQEKAYYDYVRKVCVEVAEHCGYRPRRSRR